MRKTTPSKCSKKTFSTRRACSLISSNHWSVQTDLQRSADGGSQETRILQNWTWVDNNNGSLSKRRMLIIAIHSSTTLTWFIYVWMCYSVFEHFINYKIHNECSSVQFVECLIVLADGLLLFLLLESLTYVMFEKKKILCLTFVWIKSFFQTHLQSIANI
jgi:hypothetical protein